MWWQWGIFLLVTATVVIRAVAYADDRPARDPQHGRHRDGGW